MLMIPNACDRRGLASTSTLTTSTTPSYFAASFSISGATILQGPHQAAQKSTTTGLSLFRTSASKVSSVAALISATRQILSPASRQASQARSAGERLKTLGRLEDPRIREAVVDRTAVAARRDESGRAKHREVLAHVRHLAGHPPRKLAHGRRATGEGLEDAQALGVTEGASDGGRALSVLLGGCQVVDHVIKSVTGCAKTQVPVCATPRRRILGGDERPTRHPRRHRGDTGAPGRPRPPHADAVVGDRGPDHRRGLRRAPKGGPAVPQGRAPPEDRVVQGAGGPRADRVPDVRAA